MEDLVGYFSIIAQDILHNITAYDITLFQSCISRGYSIMFMAVHLSSLGQECIITTSFIG